MTHSSQTSRGVPQPSHSLVSSCVTEPPQSVQVGFMPYPRLFAPYLSAAASQALYVGQILLRLPGLFRQVLRFPPSLRLL